jgi:hypothetical protein
MNKRNRYETTSTVETSSKHVKPVSIFELSQNVRHDTVGIEQVTQASWFQREARELLFAKLSVPDELLDAIADSNIKDTLIDEYLKWAPTKIRPAQGILKTRDQIDSSCRFIIFKVDMLEDSRRSFSIRQNYEATFMTDIQKSSKYNSVDGIWQSNLFFKHANITAHSVLIEHLIALMNQQLDLFGNDFTYPLIIAFDYYENRIQPLNNDRSSLHQDSTTYNTGTQHKFTFNYIKLGLLFVDDYITRGTEFNPIGGNNVFSMPVTAGNLLVWKENAFYHETPVLNASDVFRFSQQTTMVLEGVVKSKKDITTERLRPSDTGNALRLLTSQHLNKHSTGELPLHNRNFLRILFYKEGGQNWNQGVWMPYNPVVPTYEPFELNTMSIPVSIPSLQDRIFGRSCNRELVSATTHPDFVNKYTAGGSKIKNRTRKKKTHNTRRKINKCKNYKKTKNKRTIKRVKYGSKIGGDGSACSLNINSDFIIYGTPDVRIPLQISY